MSRNGLRVGQRVTFLTWTEPRYVGTVREFGGRASEYRGTEYRSARVEWKDGTSSWLSSLDLQASK